MKVLKTIEGGTVIEGICLRKKIKINRGGPPVYSVPRSIYSTSDMKRHHMAILFPLEMRAITRSIASSVTGYQSVPSTLNLANLVDGSYLEDAIDNYWHKINSGIQVFGIYSGVGLHIDASAIHK